jgi:hypothetical protein
MLDKISKIYKMSNEPAWVGSHFIGTPHMISETSHIPGSVPSCAGEEQVQQAIHHVEDAEHRLEHAQAEERQAEEEVHAAEHELEQFEKDRCKGIYFYLDGEREVTHQRDLTPNQIIVEYGHKNPATYYLIQIEDGREVNNYKDKGDTVIHMKDDTHYQMISNGPTPVSDGRPKSGIDMFMEGLFALGYTPTLLAGTTDHVHFDYVVPVGRYAGRTVKLGLIVPSDFPFSIPTGPHISPSIHPINAVVGPHPLYGVHANRFTSDGTDWQYWSRPLNDWKERKKTVTTYMGHILRLWETQ